MQSWHRVGSIDSPWPPSYLPFPAPSLAAPLAGPGPCFSPSTSLGRKAGGQRVPGGSFLVDQRARERGKKKEAAFSGP